MTHSHAQAPSSLRYSQGINLTYTQGYAIPYNFFQYDGAEATSISITPPLPAGITFVTDISLNEGSMWGTPTATAASTDHLVTVTNPDGSATLGINVTVFEPGSNKVYINTNTILKNSVSEGFSSAVICWLTDSSAKQDIRPALRKMRTGSLRFPYGHLSDNYLWHDIDEGDPLSGLRPIVASDSQTPSFWTWATNRDGTFIDAMDFDEYMSICTELEIQPLVVVNILSHKYTNGPSLDRLIETAAAWVQYAKDKNYEVAYWQIGNEIDHHPDLITQSEYVSAYHQMVDAMKAVDPTILTGTGLLGNINYLRAVVDANPDNVDFLSAHQYLWQFDLDTYENWRDYTGSLIPNVNNAVTVSKENGNIPVLITETNTYGPSPLLEGNSVNNFLKALCWFQLLMEQMYAENVQFSYYWGTTDPWNISNGGLADDETYTLLKNDATLSMRAEISRIVNENTLDNLVSSSTSISKVRTYASVDASKDRVNLFFLNKDTISHPVNVTVDGTSIPPYYSIRHYTADSPDSFSANYVNSTEEISITANSFSMDLPPLCVTVISFYQERNFETLFSHLLPEEDENSDGKSNYLNYAHGFDPENPIHREGFRFDGETLLFAVRNNVTDVHSTLYRSPNLSDWYDMIPVIDYVATLKSQDSEQSIYRGVIDKLYLDQDEYFFRQDFSTSDPQ